MTPSRSEIANIAGYLGLAIDEEQAAVYQQHITGRLSDVERFMRLRIPEDHADVSAPERSRGWQPATEEDPYNAWLWKCDIRSDVNDNIMNGKSVSFKDNVAVAGIPLTLGSYLLEGYRPEFDATIVTRLLEAGATVIGKNSMNGPTNAWGAGMPSDFGRPLNPHNPDHLTGGSSSGSAAAVAAGQVDVAFGGDQGGSIRIPASYCGVYGLKPTFGIVPHTGIGFGADHSLDHAGPMARYVEDLALALDAVVGYDPNDPRQDSGQSFIGSTIDMLDKGIEGLRLGVLEEAFADASQDVQEAVHSAIDTLSDLGAIVERVSVPEHDLADFVQGLLDIEGSRAVFDTGYFGAGWKGSYPTSYIGAAYDLYHSHGDRLKPRVKLNLIMSEIVRRRFRGTMYAKAQNLRNALSHAIDRSMANLDMFIMPTCLYVAPRYIPPVNEFSSAAWDLGAVDGVPRTRATAAYNLTGHPALSIPCGKAGGLPIGMQIVGRRFADGVLLRTAYAFEHSVDWEALIGIDRLTTCDDSDRQPGGAYIGSIEASEAKEVVADS